MKAINPNYIYGRGIIWKAYKYLLFHERETFRRKTEILKALGQNLLDSNDTTLNATEIIETFNSMSVEQRKLLYMRYCYGMTIKELAEMYGITSAAMSQRMTRYRKMFREAWEAGGDE